MKPLKRSVPWSKRIPIYLFVLPGMLYFLINNYLPMAGVIIAFKNINYKLGILQSPWAGLDNFKFLFSSGDAWIVMRNTLLYNIAFIIIGTIIPIMVAILLNEIRSKFASRVYQTLILLPFLMSMVVVSYLAYAFLSGENGFVNSSVLPMLGIDKPIAFYQEKAYWPYILIFVNLWKNLGFSTIIYLASVVGISPEYYEAARIDGAGKWQQFRKVTLPSLMPTIVTLFVLNVGRIFYSDFGLFFQVPKNSGMLAEVTQTIDVYVYNMLMGQNNIGMASAAGLFQSVVGFVLVIFANQMIRWFSKEHAMF